MADLEPGAGGIPEKGIYGPTEKDITDSRDRSKRSKVLNVLESKQTRPVVNALAGAATLGAAGLAAHEASQLVSAETITPTSTTTPTRTSTPYALGTQVAAEQTRVADLAKEKADKDRLAELQARAAALQTPATATPRPTDKPTQPPTLVPANATAAAEATRLKALGGRQAEIIATATRDAELTATSEAKIEATAVAKQATATATSERARERNQGGGPPGILGFAATLGAGAVLLYGAQKRQWLLDHTPQPVKDRMAGAWMHTPQPARDRMVGAWTWVRNRFGGTPPAGGGTPTAGGGPATTP